MAAAVADDQLPAAGETPEGFQVLQEGQGRVLYQGDGAVFYNPVQEFNRDLSICVISEFARVRREEREADRLKKQQRRQAQKQQQQQQPPPPAAAAATAAGDKLDVLEALAATGLRSMRYWKELGPEVVNKLVVNDLLDTAVTTIRRNIAFNGLPTDNVIASQGDANMVMHQARAQGQHFSVIDLDPYGTAVPFLDAAVQAVEDGGLLAVTCTDKAVLCGSNSEKCFSMYRSMSLKGEFCHEQAVRIVLQAIDSAATRYGRYVEPLLSMSIDFYVRVFVRVRMGQQEAKLAASKHSKLYACSSCGTTALEPLGRVAPRSKAAAASASASSGSAAMQVDEEDGEAVPQKDAPLEFLNRDELLQLVRRQQVRFSAGAGPAVPQRCPHCQGSWQVGGPIWSDVLHDPTFLDRCIAAVEAKPERFGTHKRMLGQLSACRQELPDVPLSWGLSKVASVIRTGNPRHAEFRSALMHLGYRQSMSHAAPGSLKTDAPAAVVWELMRQHAVRQMPEPANAQQMSPAEIRQSKLDQARAREEAKRGKNFDRLFEAPPGLRLLLQPAPEPRFEANWSIHPDYQELELPTYLPNPEKNWGPKARATGQVRVVDKAEAQAQHRQDRKRKRTKSQACHHFATNNECPRGEECLYSHEAALCEEYRVRSAAERERNLARKRAKQQLEQQQQESLADVEAKL